MANKIIFVPGSYLTFLLHHFQSLGIPGFNRSPVTVNLSRSVLFPFSPTELLVNLFYASKLLIAPR